MWRWNHSPAVPPHIHIFCRLSRKVSSHIILCICPYSFLCVKSRVLLCGIRDLGGCPCPRCCLPMASIPSMGTKPDALRRERLERKDDDTKRHKVSMARKFIYEQGRNVDSEAVERVLKPESLVPTHVCVLIDHHYYSFIVLTLTIFSVLPERFLRFCC